MIFNHYYYGFISKPILYLIIATQALISYFIPLTPFIILSLMLKVSYYFTLINILARQLATK